ncbi:MAG: hypothetical protein H0T99_00285 [Geodermatophilaceae bacterium]|nr:hypothetical protein [Geodermatophilaceae bacterium]MDQ3476942.1 hypothetical protein [Actinomycetota bacterium]
MAGISPADVGHRMVVRRRLPGRTGPSGGQAYTDVLGVVEHCAAGAVSIRRSDDTLIEMLIVDVVRAKRVPPPPVRRWL